MVESDDWSVGDRFCNDNVGRDWFSVQGSVCVSKDERILILELYIRVKV